MQSGNGRWQRKSFSILFIQILFGERANRIDGVAFFLGPAGGLLHELCADAATTLVGIGMENGEGVAG